MAQYKLPKEVREREEALVEERLNNVLNGNGHSGNGNGNDAVVIAAGHAYSGEEKQKLVVENGYDVGNGMNLWAPVSEQSKTIDVGSSSSGSSKHREHKKKEHKHKSHKSHKSHKEHKHRSSKHDTDANLPMPLPNPLPIEQLEVPVPVPIASSVSVIAGGDGSWRGRKDPTSTGAGDTGTGRKPISRDSHTTNSYAGMNRVR